MPPPPGHAERDDVVTWHWSLALVPPVASSQRAAQPKANDGHQELTGLVPRHLPARL